MSKPRALVPTVGVKIESWTTVGSIGARHWYWRAIVELRGGGKTDPIGPECFTEEEAQRECQRAIEKWLPGWLAQRQYACHPDIRDPDEKWIRAHNAKVRKAKSR